MRIYLISIMRICRRSGAAGFAPEILANARNHHDLFHRVRVSQSVGQSNSQSVSHSVIKTSSMESGFDNKHVAYGLHVAFRRHQI